jgi:DNA-3-methyladenine glycosylase II
VVRPASGRRHGGRPAVGPSHDGSGPTAAVVRPVPPFDLELTARVLARVPANAVDRWDGDAYRRVVAGRVLEVRQRGEELEVRCRDGLPAGWADALGRLLGLDVDLADFHAMARRDPHLRPLVDRLPGLKPQRFPTVFEALLNGVCCQQVSLAAGIATLNRVCARCGEGVDGLLAAPPPERVRTADLDGVGLSRQKQGYLRELAARADRGELDDLEGLPTPAAYERLRSLRGVGRWTAEYVLLRGLGRLDAFPADDLGAVRNLARLLRVPRLAPHEVRMAVDRWGPWKGMVYFYLAAWRQLGYPA